MNIQNIRLTGIFVVTASLLLIAFIAMKLTGEVKWSSFDFIVAGILLLGTGLICELVLRKFQNVGQRLAICGLVFVGLVLIWIELAVGLFGTPFAGN